MQRPGYWMNDPRRWLDPGFGDIRPFGRQSSRVRDSTTKGCRNSCTTLISRPAVEDVVTVGLRCLAAVIVLWDLRRCIRVRWRTARGDLGPWRCERRACVNRSKHPEAPVASCSRRCEANPRHRAGAPSFLTPKPMMIWCLTKRLSTAPNASYSRCATTRI